MRTTREADIAFAAGLFEGEGSIVGRRIPRDGYVTVNIRMNISMTDKEPLDKIQSILGGRMKGPYKPRKEVHSPYWVWTISNWQQVLEATALIRPWLGTRRQKQIDTALAVRPPSTNPQGTKRSLRGPMVPPGRQCPPEPIPSQLGYQRHHRLGEPACDICKASQVLWNKEYKARRREVDPTYLRGRDASKYRGHAKSSA